MLNISGRSVPPFFATLLLALPLAAVTCSAADEESPLPDDSGMRHLLVSVVAADSGDSAAARDLEEEIGDLPHFGEDLPSWLEGRRFELRRAGADELRSGEAAGASPHLEVVVGLLPLPEPVRRWADGLPVELDGERLRFDGTRYEARSTAAVFRLPGEPARWLVTGAAPEAVADAASRALSQAAMTPFPEGHPARQADYQIYENPWLGRVGPWRRDGARWAANPRAERDRIAERARWLDGLEPIASGPVRLLVPPGQTGDARYRGLAQALGEGAQAMARRLGGEAGDGTEQVVTLALEPDHVSQARHTTDIGPAVPGGPADLHAVFHPRDSWAIQHALAKLLLRRAGLDRDAPEESGGGGAEPARRPVWALEGTAGWLRSEVDLGWYGQPFDAWPPLLAAGDALPTADELLARERVGDDSAPLWTPVAVAVVARLPGETAEEKLAAFRRPAVEEALAQIRAQALRTTEPRSEGDGPERLAARPGLPGGFLRGVSLAHQVRLEGGYHSPKVAERLDELIGLGTDSVALMPFAFQRDADAPGMAYLNHNPTSEHDAGVLHAARAAHERGLTVLWKPQIWVGGSWPGELEMTSAEDWASWWRTYRRFILHHAVLAEYAGAELLSVGVELERTVERPEWEELIAAVRGIYSGALTYSANWGSGAERATFWDRLDAVGVDAYYPLADATEEVSDEVLADGAERVAERLGALAERTGKPLLLTEVGFAARRATWAEPHAKGGTLSETDQARAYRALFGALSRRATDGAEGAEPAQGWLRGVYVWKAFSDPGSRGGESPDFKFLGRPAEDVIAGFFRSLAARRAGPAGSGREGVPREGDARPPAGAGGPGPGGRVPPP